jgi:S-adenosylmethionine uptake transporter
MTSPRPSLLLPVLATILGLAVFAVMDGFMKAGSIAIGAYGAIFWRNLLGAGMMAPLWLWRGSGWPSRAVLRLHLVRGVVAAVMATLFFYGLVRTPMAEAMALSFIAPLIALYLAAVLLGEKVGARAIAGSVLGLVGVLVIGLGKFGGSGGEHSPEALKGLAAILASAVLYAWNLILQRQQAQVAGPEEIAFFQAVTVFLVLGIGAPWLAQTPDRDTWLVLVAAAVLAAASLMLLSWAYARAEAQVLVPLEYTAFIWAALTGWVAFAEPVTGATLAGVVLIVGGCLIAAPKQDRAELPA